MRDMVEKRCMCGAVALRRIPYIDPEEPTKVKLGAWLCEKCIEKDRIVRREHREKHPEMYRSKWRL